MLTLYIFYPLIGWCWGPAQLPNLAKNTPSPPSKKKGDNELFSIKFTKLSRTRALWKATASIQSGGRAGKDRTGSRKEEMRGKCVTDPAFSWQFRCSCNHTPNVTMKCISLLLLLLCACSIKAGTQFAATGTLHFEHLPFSMGLEAAKFTCTFDGLQILKMSRHP